MKTIKRVFRLNELMGQENIIHYMAHELLEMGAPIKFNKLDIELDHDGIEFYGEMRNRIRMDGSHEFIFEIAEEANDGL